MIKHQRAIYAFDLGTTTGWAFMNQDQTIISGSQSFALRRFDGGGMRFLRFNYWLYELMQTIPCVVYFEEVRRHIGVDAAHVYGGFLAQLTTFCEQKEIPYEGIPVGTIKKHIAGKGNASKQDVIRAVQSLGHNPIDDNQADAIALLDFAFNAYHK